MSTKIENNYSMSEEITSMNVVTHCLENISVSGFLNVCYDKLCNLNTLKLVFTYIRERIGNPVEFL